MISEDLIQQFVKETELFEERTQAFESGEIDRKTFKGISGRFGCYAQREKNYMLRLRFPGGRISKNIWLFLGKDKRISPGAYEDHYLPDHPGTQSVCFPGGFPYAGGFGARDHYHWRRRG